MKTTMKKNIGKTIIYLLSGIVIGLVLLISAFLLPTERIERNVEKSVPMLVKETKYYSIIDGYESTLLDNSTDSLMLLNALYDGDEGIIKKSMHVYRNVTEGENDPVKFLANYYSKEEESHKVSYGRYWHGYLIILKPLLLFLDYSNIRMLSGILQPILIALVAILMYKKKKENYILPYLVSILMISPFTVMLSLQYSTIFYISNLSLIALLLLNDRLKSNNSYIFYFLIVGMITSYFDLLTYPLAALGLPLIMYFILKEDDDLWKNIKDLFFNACMWSIGYIVMWGSKLVVGSVLTGDNLFKSAFDAFELRTSNKVMLSTITPSSVITKNLNLFINKPHMILLIIASIYFIYKFVKSKSTINKYTFYRIIPYILIACIPFAWYVITGNHSYIHSFFTYRLLIVTVFAFLAGAMSIIEKERTSSNENKEGNKERNKRGKAKDR